MKLLLAALAFLITSPSLAQNMLKDKDRCVAAEVSLEKNDAPYPGQKTIQNGNNLRRKTGLALLAAGDRIYFTGKIVDSECVPIADAAIEIWHADNVGLYSYKRGKEKISRDPYFAGTGRVETDNEGRFAFLTIFPGFYGERAPHINYRISHPDFKTSEGVVFFEYHPRNANDPILKQYYAKSQPPSFAEAAALAKEERFSDRRYHVQLVIKGKSLFREF